MEVYQPVAFQVKSFYQFVDSGFLLGNLQNLGLTVTTFEALKKQLVVLCQSPSLKEEPNFFF